MWGVYASFFLLICNRMNLSRTVITFVKKVHKMYSLITERCAWWKEVHFHHLLQLFCIHCFGNFMHIFYFYFRLEAKKKKNTLRLNVFCKNIFFGKITTFLFKHPVVLKKNSMDWWWKVTTKSLGCQQSNVSHQYFQMVLKSNWNSELFTGVFLLVVF